MEYLKTHSYLIFGIAVALVGIVVYVGTPHAVDQTQDPAQSYSSSSIAQTQTTSMEKIEGLDIAVTAAGTGPSTQNGQTVLVHYTGKLTDGTVFDSSIPRGEPFAFRLGAGQVIKGWDLGILGMQVGEKRTLTIAPELGYGRDGFPGVIPPNATLVFDVELMGIQ